MSCVCKQELETSVEAWCDLPLPALSAQVPSLGLAGIQQASVGLLAAAGLAGQSSASAQAQAQASAAASATAGAQALLGAYGSLGLNPLAADASARMSLAIDSMNAHLPWALGQLTATFDAHFSALATLNACLSASLVVEALFGFPLTDLGAGAKLEAALAASAQAGAQATAQASALASANASAQLAATAGGLGFDLSAPGARADFAAALSAAASFGASLALPIGSLGLAASAVAQINALGKIGLDLFAPDAELAIALNLPALFAGVEALLGLDLAAAAAAQAAAQAEATGAAGATADLDADLGLPALGEFGALSLAASLQAGLALDGALALSSPCGACPLKLQLSA